MAHRRVRASPPFLLRSRLAILLFTLFCTLLLPAFLQAFTAMFLRANDLGRDCDTSSPILSGSSSSTTIRSLNIAMVSFSEEVGGAIRRRSFRGVMDLVRENKRSYAARMGYELIDARNVVDPDRPPSWSKILAVRSQLMSHDWVFWNDADTVVTNPEISLANILLSIVGSTGNEASPDFVATEDVNGINAGVFFVRRSKWSKNFLETWWNQTSFVRFGSTKSGDNDALKYVIRNLSPDELQGHIRISPMQCLFNSYPWHPSWKSVYQLIASPRAVWRGFYLL